MLGKTSILEYTKKKLENKGFNVFTINEVPTMLLNNGFNSKKCGRIEFLKLIATIEIFLSRVLENSIIDTSNKTIILYDKSPIDNLAFISKDLLDKMLFELDTSYEKIINSFDLIIHLETVAKKYPELYSNDNNINRTLDIKLAIERNDKLLEAYNKCNNRIIIDSYKDINDKKERVIEEIEKYFNKVVE